MKFIITTVIRDWVKKPTELNQTKPLIVFDANHTVNQHTENQRD